MIIPTIAFTAVMIAILVALNRWLSVIVYKQKTLFDKELGILPDQVFGDTIEDEDTAFKKQQEKDHKKWIEKTERQWNANYGSNFAKNIDGVISRYQGAMELTHDTMKKHFIKDPSTIKREESNKILLGLPQELSVLKKLGGELIYLMCVHHISTTEILNYLAARYRLFDNYLTVPLYIVVSNGIVVRNNESPLNEKWYNEMPSPEIVISLAAEKAKENYPVIGRLEKEFDVRVNSGRIDDYIFKELLGLKRSFEEFIRTQKVFNKEFQPDVEIRQLLWVIDECYNRYKKLRDEKDKS